MYRALAILVIIFGHTPAFADSYWNHNGSLMRLIANGNSRAFVYAVPRDVLVQAGVQAGTLLFDGERQGNRYYGISRVFSRYCEAPLEYEVEGYVTNGDLRVVLTGSREVYGEGCRPTGSITTDILIFDYEYGD